MNQERLELVRLLTKILGPAPKVEYEGDVEAVRAKIAKQHDELMAILQNEEALSREFQKKKS